MMWKVEKEKIYYQPEKKMMIRARIFLDMEKIASGYLILEKEEEFEDLKRRLEETK